jgi:Uma2 family endonuclease
MGVPVVDTGPMTVTNFLAFTDSRPDDEKWELIDGEPVLNAWPSRLHQIIVKNILVLLDLQATQQRQSWEVLPGLGVRVSGTNLPVPDVLIRPNIALRNDPRGRECDDVIVAFEVLSPSTKDRDLRWKRQAYASLPSVMHYVVIAQDAVDVVVFARDADFAERRLRSPRESVEFPDLEVSLTLADIYRATGLGDA